MKKELVLSHDTFDPSRIVVTTQNGYATITNFTLSDFGVRATLDLDQLEKLMVLLREAKKNLKTEV